MIVSRRVFFNGVLYVFFVAGALIDWIQRPCWPPRRGENFLLAFFFLFFFFSSGFISVLWYVPFYSPGEGRRITSSGTTRFVVCVASGTRKLLSPQVFRSCIVLLSSSHASALLAYPILSLSRPWCTLCYAVLCARRPTHTLTRPNGPSHRSTPLGQRTLLSSVGRTGRRR